MTLLDFQGKGRKNAASHYTHYNTHTETPRDHGKSSTLDATMLWQSPAHMERPHEDLFHIPRWGPNSKTASNTKHEKMIPGSICQVTPKCWVLLDEALDIMEQTQIIPSMSCLNSWPTETMSITMFSYKVLEQNENKWRKTYPLFSRSLFMERSSISHYKSFCVFFLLLQIHSIIPYLGSQKAGQLYAL